jgi:autotransporter-associated beta strand protein
MTVLKTQTLAKHRHIWLRNSVLAALAAGVFSAATAHAQYIYAPTNNQSGNWNDSKRWTGGPDGTFPNAIDATATINLPASTAPSGNYNLQLSNTAGQSITVGAITVNNSAATTGTLRFGANGNGTLTFQSSSGPATYTENAATPTDSTFNSVIFAPVTFASDTVITQNHNLLNNGGTTFNSSNNSPGGTTAASNITVTKEGLGNIEFNVAPTAPATGFEGTLVVNAGGVRITDNVFANAAAVKVNAGGQFQLGSGTLTNWSLTPGAVLTLNGGGKDPSTVNPVGALRFQSGSGTASFDNAVTLESDSTIFVNATLAPTPPNPITFGKLTLSQVVSGAGGLVKDGGGILALAQANTYGGNTTVTNGTLLVTNSTGSATGAGSVTIGATGALGGSGFISGPVTFVGGGFLAPGASPETLHTGSLTLDALTNLNYELATAGVVGSGVNDLTQVTGDLTLDGTLNITDFGGFGLGVYRLFDYTGQLINNGLSLGSTPSGFAYAIDTSIANQVNLTVTAVPEPSTLAMAGLGMGILGLAWRRNKRRAG